jgi:hypothetical protein
MARQLKSRGLTLPDVIVFVVVVVILTAILLLWPRGGPPQSSRVRCMSNLHGIGKAMAVYANDYGDRLPRAGGPDSAWGPHLLAWRSSDRSKAFGLSRADGSGGQATISASLYLLVKYEEVVPELFVCPYEKSAEKFTFQRYGIRDRKLTDVWDFGPNPPDHCSYAYQMVYGSNESELTTSGDPRLALAADRAPWIDSPFGGARSFVDFQPDLPPYNGTKDGALAGNSLAHNGDGQVVLFLDFHVEFAKRAYCGLDDDNIYTSWDGDDKVRGAPPVPCESQPASAADSLLVNDRPVP